MELRRIHYRASGLLIGLVVLARAVSGCGSLESEPDTFGSSQICADGLMNIESASQNLVGNSITTRTLLD
jgi:hypothetical protein